MDRISPIPRDSVWIAVDPQGRMTGYLSMPADNWLVELTTRLDNSANRIVSVARPATGEAALEASIAPTSLPVPSTSSGLYRVTVYARITRAGTVSSSLIVTIGSTDGSVVCSQSGAALTTNTTASVQSVSFLVRRDQATAITYSTTYASAGATSAQYRLDLLVEAL